MSLVIMNPPFTRNDLRHDQLSKEERRDLSKRRNKSCAKSTFPKDLLSLTTSGPMFMGLAKAPVENITPV